MANIEQTIVDDITVRPDGKPSLVIAILIKLPPWENAKEERYLLDSCIGKEDYIRIDGLLENVTNLLKTDDLHIN